MAAELSVVIAVARTSRSLLETIDSALRQTASVRDVLLAVDRKIAARERAALEGIASGRGQVVTADGTAAALATAFARAGGELLLLCEPGDVLAADLGERAASALAAQPLAALVAPAWRTRWPSGRLSEPVHPRLELDALLADSWSAPRSLVVRREAAIESGGPRSGTEPHQLLDLCLTLLALERRGLVIPEALVEYRPGRGTARRLALSADGYESGFRALLESHRDRFAGCAPRCLAERLAASHATRAHYQEILEQRDRALAEIATLEGEITAARGELRLEHDSVDFAELRRLAPVSRQWGEDRGRPVDRFYIEAFVRAHREDVRGRVLEIQEDDLTQLCGGALVERIDVVDIEAENARATHLADLRRMPHIGDSSYDCIILTQTLHLIADVQAVLTEVRRILRPGGVLLATLPATSRVCLEYGFEGDFWRTTEAGARRMFEGAFAADEVEVHRYGNLLSSVAFLEGLARHELQPEELEPYDPWYPLIMGVRAFKRPHAAGATDASPSTTSAARLRVADGQRGAILLYHRIGEQPFDPHRLAVPTATFVEHLHHLARLRPMPLDELARRAAAGTLPSNAVAITLDDAYGDNLTAASPALTELGLPATFFTTSGVLEEPSPYWWDLLAAALLDGGVETAEIELHTPERRSFAIGTPKDRRRVHDLLHGELVLARAEQRDDTMSQIGALCRPDVVAALPRPLDGAGLRELSARPGHDIGAHGCRHLALPVQPKERQLVELVESKRALESALGRPVTAFAYPYGAASAAVAQRARTAGFELAVDCEPVGVTSASDPWRLPRIEIHRDNAHRLAELLDAAFAAPASARRPA